MSASFSYRRDIEGLRAVAVLAVVLYHLPIGGVTLAGGFLGVDLFFVLSGYLITGLLAAQLTGPQQPALGPWLKAFFLRRCKRLLPALIAVIAVTLALGFLIM
ncbi:MAG: acyltransferase family protein, partial [Pseudomonadota bacterium]